MTQGSPEGFRSNLGLEVAIPLGLAGARLGRSLAAARNTNARKNPTPPRLFNPLQLLLRTQSRSVPESHWRTTPSRRPRIPTGLRQRSWPPHPAAPAGQIVESSLKLREAGHHSGLVAFHGLLNLRKNIGVFGGHVAFLGWIAPQMEKERWLVRFRLGLAVTRLRFEMRLPLADPAGKELVTAIVEERALRESLRFKEQR